MAAAELRVTATTIVFAELILMVDETRHIVSREALALLVGSIFVGLSPDRLRLINASGGSLETCVQGGLSSWAEARDVYTPVEPFLALTGRFGRPLAVVRLVELTATVFFATPEGTSAKRSLHYLEARAEREATQRSLEGRRPRRSGGAFARLSKMLRWR